ncbi:DUF2306 domain-containing protein [Nocardiopsis aegyptia]|uniref:Uncharacterized membrane protein YozB (DUF420 family) n=1 Tax=Nocardiopsis aegyptia TaxID=220378 RepID=A0A7Z0EJ20_9ACTN|nr:DUF2306 domain-containing protein [Nocardiopsis aegyptia]NYJ32921.1 uncharacterized membrane protein YozB (DUF420 family) [Nocardiopsis aegyptia]
MTTTTASSAPERGPRRTRPAPRWWERPWIAPLALFSLVFLLYSVPPYLALDPARARLPVPDHPSWYFTALVTHIFGGTLLTLLVIVQVWPWVRRRYPAVHRWSGRAYVLAGVPFVGVPALLIAPYSGSGAGGQVSNTVWAVLWLSFTVAGYVMARRRRFAAHREWMLRSFALVFGIAFNRVLLIVLILVMLPRVDTVYGGDVDAMGLALGPASGFLSWIIPLLAVEWWLKYRRPRRRVPRSA